MVNTEEIYDTILDEFLQKRGHRFDLELKRSMMGLKAEDAIEVLNARFELSESHAEIRSEVENLFQKHLATMLKPMDGLRQLLELVDRLNLPRGVATSSPRSLALLSLKLAQIESGFQFVLTGDDVTNGKPDPEMYLMAAQRFGVQPHEMMVLEDSRTGSLAAARAGALTIAIPGQHSEGLDFSHADQVLSSLNSPEIRQILESSI